MTTEAEALAAKRTTLAPFRCPGIGSMSYSYPGGPVTEHRGCPDCRASSVTTAPVTPSEDEASAAKRTTLAPGWRWATLRDWRCNGCPHLADVFCHASDCTYFYCESCARARGAFLVEVIEKGAEP